MFNKCRQAHGRQVKIWPRTRGPAILGHGFCIAKQQSAPVPVYLRKSRWYKRKNALCCSIKDIKVPGHLEKKDWVYPQTSTASIGLAACVAGWAASQPAGIKSILAKSVDKNHARLFQHTFTWATLSRRLPFYPRNPGWKKNLLVKGFVELWPVTAVTLGRQAQFWGIFGKIVWNWLLSCSFWNIDTQRLGFVVSGDFLTDSILWDSSPFSKHPGHANPRK